ncbi:unnamed protein product [Prorocentrum cordatum]|uniref:Serine-threonine/tyrosine-protein kinase catalytic domain-containing protein n=1 Tax=Prorocentrum cordatum TaxID=2364126 RepID=A0ABN9VST9_9DINO|nr:unnamed protein product [Polarella glacialis]
MVMLEILTGLAPAAPDPHRPGSIVYPVQEHLMPSHSGALERCLRQLDASAGWPPALAREMVLLALRCVERDDDLRRPRFVEVVRKLRSMRECYPASAAAPCRTLEQHCPAPDRHALDAQQGAGAAADAEETAATGRQQQQQQQPPRWAGKADSPAAPPPLPPSLFLPHSEAPRPAALPWWEEATPKNALPALAPKAPFGGARGASPARSPSSPLRPRLAWKDAAATPPAPAGLLNVPVAALSRGCSPSRVPGGRARSSSRAPEDGGGGSMGLPAPDGATPRAGASFRAEEISALPPSVAVPVEVSSDAPHLVGPPSVGALSQSSPSRTRGFSVASSAVDVSAASAVVAARGAPFLLELVFAEGLDVGSVPPELRFLPLVPAAGSPVGTGSEAPRFAPVGRSHHPEVLEAWLPSLELRNCISRTAFEVSWTPGSSDARRIGVLVAAGVATTRARVALADSLLTMIEIGDVTDGTSATADPLQRADPWHHREGMQTNSSVLHQLNQQVPLPGLDLPLLVHSKRLHPSVYAKLTAHVDFTCGEFMRTTARTVAETIHAETKVVSERVGVAEGEIAQLRRRIADSEREEEAQRTAIGEINRTLAIAEAQLLVPDVIADAGFHRLPDLSVFAIGAPDLKATQLSWVDPAVASLVADAPAERFALRQLGGKVITSPRTTALARCLKVAGGAWRQFGTSAVSGQTIPLLVSTGRGPRQIGQESQARRLRLLLEGARAQTDFRPREQTGRVSVAGVPLARLDIGAAARGDAEVVWNFPRARALQLDADGLERAFHGVVFGPPSVKVVSWDARVFLAVHAEKRKNILSFIAPCPILGCDTLYSCKRFMALLRGLDAVVDRFFTYELSLVKFRFFSEFRSDFKSRIGVELFPFKYRVLFMFRVQVYGAAKAAYFRQLGFGHVKFLSIFELFFPPYRARCALGCCGTDEIQHYLECERLVHRTCLPRAFTHGAALARLGPGNPDECPKGDRRERFLWVTVRHLCLSYYMVLELTSLPGGAPLGNPQLDDSDQWLAWCLPFVFTQSDARDFDYLFPQMGDDAHEAVKQRIAEDARRASWSGPSQQRAAIEASLLDGGADPATRAAEINRRRLLYEQLRAPVPANSGGRGNFMDNAATSSGHDYIIGDGVPAAVSVANIRDMTIMTVFKG